MDFVYADVYVSSVFPFTRNDPALLIWSNKYPNGLYNLPSSRQGKYLVFMPLDTENVSMLSVSEIRVWSMKDLATGCMVKGPSTVLRYVGPIDTYCYANTADAACKGDSDWEASVKPFYVDLAAKKKLSGIWVFFGFNTSTKICVAHSDTVPFIGNSFVAPNKLCFTQTEIY